MNVEALESLTAKIQRRATYWVHRWAWHHRQTPLIDDCVSAGLEVLFTVGHNDPRVWWEIQNAIQNEISRWLYGVNRGSAERALKIPIRLSATVLLPSIDAAPDIVAEARVTVDRMYAYLTATSRGRGRPLTKMQREKRARALWVWQELALSGCLFRKDYEARSWNSNQIFDARQLLKQMVRGEVDLAPAGRNGDHQTL